MDPFRIAVRALFAYVFLLLAVRLSGKRTVKQGNVLDLTVALIAGDLVDNMIWAEVAVMQFVVAAGILFAVHALFDFVRYRTAGSAAAVQRAPGEWDAVRKS
jgi:uncharacterized membrane protein YcaP (DUF421 family)